MKIVIVPTKNVVTINNNYHETLVNITNGIYSPTAALYVCFYWQAPSYRNKLFLTNIIDLYKKGIIHLNINHKYIKFMNIYSGITILELIKTL